MYKKILGFVNSIPEFRTTIVKETIEETQFQNNSRILCLPVGNDGSYIRGFNCDILIEDEASYISDEINDEVLEPFLATKKDGKIIKLSTPKGRRGHFYKSYLNQIYKVHHYDYKKGVEAGLISQEYIERKKKEMDSLSFSQEYCGDFVDESAAYFSSNMINRNTQDYNLFDIHSIIPSEDYVLGCDVSRLGVDKTAFIVIKRGIEGDLHKVVFVYSIGKSKLDSLATYIQFLDKKFNFSRVVIDETGVGSGLVDFLQRQMGDYRVEGVTFTNKKKIELYSTLRNHFENNKIIIPNHPELLKELKQMEFEYNKLGTLKIHHPNNCFDDLSDALALSLHGATKSKNYPCIGAATIRY